MLSLRCSLSKWRYLLASRLCESGVQQIRSGLEMSIWASACRWHLRPQVQMRSGAGECRWRRHIHIILSTCSFNLFFLSCKRKWASAWIVFSLLTWLIIFPPTRANSYLKGASFFHSIAVVYGQMVLFGMRHWGLGRVTLDAAQWTRRSFLLPLKVDLLPFSNLFHSA